MKKNKILFGSLAFILCLASCKNKQADTHAGGEVKAYRMLTLTTQDVELQSSYPAVLKGLEDVEIKPRVDGYIESILVDEGAVVRKGQVLFKINSPAAVQQIESAEASYNTAKLDVERIRPLAEKGIVSEVKLKASENVLASAKAAYNQAKATLNWASVTSPVDGVVGTINLRKGSLATNSTILTTVSNNSKVVAYFSVNEKDLLSLLQEYEGNTQAEKLKNMPDLRLILADGSEYAEKGRIETISGVVDATSGSVSFRAVFPNKQGMLRSGSSARVLIPQMEEGAIVIPQQVTFMQQDKVLAYCFQGDSVQQRVLKVKSSSDGQSFVVTEGLKVGEKIVVEGVSTLTNGRKIKELK
jgi:membrane fusion protein, multidrug efflux system